VIFVTGGTGLLGNCIVRELCQRAEPTRVLCRDQTPRTAFDDLQVEIVAGDLSDVDVLNSATRDCRAVIHSAAYIHIGWGKLAQSRQVNVEGTRAMVRACLKNQARLVYVSTVDTLPAATSLDQPISECNPDAMDEPPIAKTPCSYVVSKIEAEQVVRDAIRDEGLDAVIVHPGFMLGPYDWKPSSGRMMLEVSKAPIVAAPAGGCSVCDARDVAVAIANSIHMGGSGGNYILAGDNVTYQQFWREILATAGKQRRVRKMGRGIKIVGNIIDAAVRWLPIVEGDVNGAAISMGMLNHYYDSSLAERVLGYQRRPRSETLAEAWEWLSQHFLQRHQ
jgi:dihydroflavonol-4-reductase